jgi:hypothetical protein
MFLFEIPAASMGSRQPAAVSGLGKITALTAAFISLTGCGSSTNAPTSVSSPTAPKPDVVVTVDGARHACVVALRSEAQGSIIPCDDVVPFVRDELRLPSGSIYDIRTTPDVPAAQMAKVEASLKGAGYRFSGAP